MAESEQSVRIRMVMNGKTIGDQQFAIESAEICLPESISVFDAFSVADLAVGAGIPVLPPILGVLQAIRHSFETPTVQVFIQTKVVGPVLTGLIGAVIENLRAEMKHRREVTKAKKLKVTLFGPDGKEIKWDE